MNLLKLTPGSLLFSPWNSNSVTAENQQKLRHSVEELGQFRPIIVRELPSGEYQVLAGEHTTRAMIDAGMSTVDVYNLGPIDDIRAKAISVADNHKYGVDDTTAMSALLKEISEEFEVSMLLPFNETDLTEIFTAGEIDLDSLGFDEEEEKSIDEEMDEALNRPGRTHEILRFKVSLENVEAIRTVIETTIKQQAFTDEDSLVNAGLALAHNLIGNRK